MKLMKTRPTNPMLGGVDRLMDQFFQVPFFPDVPARQLEFDWEPLLDLSETDAQYIVRLEAPGAHRENLDVSLDGEFLTVTGRREFRKEDKGENFLWQERKEGRFSRTLRLPGGVDAENVKAQYQEGILTVMLPKLVAKASNRITIS